jgi:hypothetical protein
MRMRTASFLGQVVAPPAAFGYEPPQGVRGFRQASVRQYGHVREEESSTVSSHL